MLCILQSAKTRELWRMVACRCDLCWLRGTKARHRDYIISLFQLFYKNTQESERKAFIRKALKGTGAARETELQLKSLLWNHLVASCKRGTPSPICRETHGRHLHFAAIQHLSEVLRHCYQQIATHGTGNVGADGNGMCFNKLFTKLGLRRVEPSELQLATHGTRICR